MSDNKPLTIESIEKEFDREAKKSDHFCKVCHKWGKSFYRQKIEKLLKGILKRGHGGGNWRRLISLALKGGK